MEKDARPRRILVVDDDPVVLRFIALLLQEAGFAVQTATDGVDAVTLATAHPPDLILLDIHMPRMDGREVIRTLRERGYHVPVILMSAGHDAESEARRLGAAGSLRKPFSADTFLDTVNHVLRVRARRSLESGADRRTRISDR